MTLEDAEHIERCLFKIRYIDYLVNGNYDTRSWNREFSPLGATFKEEVNTLLLQEKQRLKNEIEGIPR